MDKLFCGFRDFHKNVRFAFFETRKLPESDGSKKKEVAKQDSSADKDDWYARASDVLYKAEHLDVFLPKKDVNPQTGNFFTPETEVQVAAREGKEEKKSNFDSAKNAVLELLNTELHGKGGNLDGQILKAIITRYGEGYGTWHQFVSAYKKENPKGGRAINEFQKKWCQENLQLDNVYDVVASIKSDSEVQLAIRNLDGGSSRAA